MYKTETNYPSIDKTHEKNEKFFDVHPIIPSLSIYNAIKLISSLYKKDDAIDCLELTISYDDLINNAALLSKSFKELGILKI